MILGQPPEAWPAVDCLLSWHSEGFPLDKALVRLCTRGPYLRRMTIHETRVCSESVA